MPLMLDETVRVSVAVATAPGTTFELSLSQVMVMGPFAPAGFQLAFVMLKVIWTVPVFLT